MKAIFFICAIAAAQTQPQSQSQNSAPAGSLTGTVIDSVTHQPIKKARVSATCASPTAGNMGGMQNHAVSTDTTGAFLFDNNLPPGTCFVGAIHPDYPQGGPVGRPKSVNINPSEKNGPVTLELVPPATVSGRIVDEDGDPMVGCFVQAHPAAQPNQSNAVGNAKANGEYRIFNIPAGRFYLSARCANNVFQARPFSSGPDPPPSRAYPQEFYPLASDVKSAQVVTLTPAMEKSGIDFQMRPAAVTQVRVVLSIGGAPVSDSSNLNVQLVSVEQGDQFMNGPIRNMQAGVYEFRQVFPGSYFLTAFANGQDTKGLGGFQRIEVKDRPIETVLDLKPGISVSGVVTLEDGNAANKIQLNQVRVQFIPDRFGGGIRSPSAAATADGSFTLDSVASWRWRLGVNGPGVFVKSAYLGPVDVTHDAFDFPTGASGDLRIVLGTNMATISGTAPAGQMIYATYLDSGNFNSFGRAAQVDATGHFSIQQIIPGKYRLTSAAPGVPTLDDSNSLEVTVKEGETATVEIKS